MLNRVKKIIPVNRPKAKPINPIMKAIASLVPRIGKKSREMDLTEGRDCRGRACSALMVVRVMEEMAQLLKKSTSEV